MDQAGVTTTTQLSGSSVTSASVTTMVQNGGEGGGPPVLTNPGNQSSAEGAVVSLTLRASDPSGATVYFGAANLPAGLVLDSPSGTVSGTVAYSAAETQGGHYAVTITATDTNGGSASQTFTWAVTDTITPPVLTNPGDQTNNENDGVALALQATEPDGAPLTWTATGLPAGLTINSSTGLVSGAIGSADAVSSPYAVTVSVSNGTSSSQQSFTWNVQRIQIDNPGAQSDLEGDAVSLAVNAWEPSGAALTYSASGLPAGLSIDPNSGVIAGTVATGAASSAAYNVTVTASDGTASAATAFTWAVAAFTLDNPGDQTNAEGDAVSLQVNVETNDALTFTYGTTGLPPGLSINSGTGLISGTVANLASNHGPYSVTVSASAGATTQTQTFTWTATYITLTNPGEQISAPGSNVVLGLSASDQGGATLNYSAEGLPSGLGISGATGVISGTLSSYAAAYSPYTVTVWATDGTHTAAQSFFWVVPNGAVSVTWPGYQTTAEGAGASVQINASDPAGDSFTYTASGLPSGLSIDPNSGLISGTVDYGAAAASGGSYLVNVLADNGQGKTGSTAFTWTVTHTDQAPVVSGPGDQFNLNGDAISLAVDASDPDGDTLTYTASGLPSGLSINASTGLISGTLGASASAGSPYNVTVSASDGTLSDSDTFSWYVTTGVVTVTAPDDQENAEGDAVAVQMTANSTSQLPLTFVASGLPAGLSINATTGQISGTVSSGAATTSDGEYTVAVTASDGQGDSGTAEFFWTVDAASQAPTLTNPGSQTSAEGDDVSLQVQATGSNLVYTAGGLPAGLSIDPMSGLISGTVDYSAAQTAGGHYSSWVSVNDGQGGTATQTFAWTVSDTVPTPYVADPGLQNSQVGSAMSLQVYGGDDDGNAVSYGATGLPAGLSINAATGLITGTVSAAAGTYNPTVTVSDGSAQASVSFTWQVSQSPAPQVIIAINNTLDPSDDIGFTDPSVPVPVEVTLTGASPGLHWVTLSLGSSPHSSIDRPSFWLANGGTATVTLTPLVSSVVANDIDLVAQVDAKPAGDKKMTNVTVTIGKVRNADTPKAMTADRIPPTAKTPVTVTLSVTLTNQIVFINKGGTSSDNGDLKFLETDGDWYGCRKVKQTTTIQVKGTTQTEPGHAGNLYLFASTAPNTTPAVAGSPESNKFSVAAIPITIQMEKPQLSSGNTAIGQRTGPRSMQFFWGGVYSYKVFSDSGDAADLDQVKLSEYLALEDADNHPQTGIFKGTGLGAPDWVPATKPGGADSNGYRQSASLQVGEPGPGWNAAKIISTLRDRAAQALQDKIAAAIAAGTPASASWTTQYFRFSDARTGVPATDAGSMVVQNSGFTIRLAAWKSETDNKYYISAYRFPSRVGGAASGDNASNTTQKAQIGD